MRKKDQLWACDSEGGGQEGLGNLRPLLRLEIHWCLSSWSVCMYIATPAEYSSVMREESSFFLSGLCFPQSSRSWAWIALCMYSAWCRITEDISSIILVDSSLLFILRFHLLPLFPFLFPSLFLPVSRSLFRIQLVLQASVCMTLRYLKHNFFQNLPVLLLQRSP